MQAVTNVAPAAVALARLHDQIQQLMATGVLIQQLPVFANANGLQSVIGTLSDMSRSPILLDGTEQQSAYTQPDAYIRQNADALAAHVMTYRANSEYKRFTVPPAMLTTGGISPSLLGGAIPLPGGISGSGLFPTLMSLNGIDLAMGGEGLLSLLALV